MIRMTWATTSGESYFHDRNQREYYEYRCIRLLFCSFRSSAYAYLAFVVDVGKGPFAAVRGDTIDFRVLSGELPSMVDCC